MAKPLSFAALYQLAASGMVVSASIADGMLFFIGNPPCT